MPQQNKIQLFEQKQVRTVWDENQEKWYFSIVDVIGILTDGFSISIPAYLKHISKSKKIVGTNCNQLNMWSTDGKMRFINGNIID